MLAFARCVMEKARALLFVSYASDFSIRSGTCHRRLRCNPSKRCRSQSSRRLNGLRYPSPDAQLGEHLYPDEKTIGDK